MKSTSTKTLLILIVIVSALTTGLPGCGDTATNESTVSATAGESEREADRAATVTTTTPTSAPPAPAPAFVPGIQISFLQDPRITSTYQGDNWVSPATFTLVTQGSESIVSVRAQVLDSQGRASTESPLWIPADPAMITIAPQQGHEVSITIRSVGQSTITVTAAGFERRLQVRARTEAGAMRVDISQTE